MDIDISKLHPDAHERFLEYVNWVNTARPVSFVSYEDGPDAVKDLDPSLVATSHDTCENGQISTGFHDFGPEPRCCWFTHGWYICQNSWPVDDYISENYYAPCLTCNPDGEDSAENEEECPDCYSDGWMTYHFDDLLDPLEGQQ